MKNIVLGILSESLRVKETFIVQNAEKLILLAEKVASAFTGDRKLMICGNCGSAADAQHITAEFVNRYELERPPLPALSLTTDSSVLTSIGNDYTFDDVFSKQIKALGVEGDVLLAISTSGHSRNILNAVRDAQNKGIYAAAFTGREDGKLAEMADLSLNLKSAPTARVQEAHILAGHILCHLVDYILFQKPLPEDRGADGPVGKDHEDDLR